ncbi:DMT family transporter [Terasakiella sp. A23]|uniref:DMT family transporter n=1 Tax=Terasakiella sp. FCG-A23 TaxID=3080561 RepID=UPI0029554C9C|nr:DMT family transporter [Terasakiella sp. A23]MDV7338015.1 DMT family transporter [Terasakiella sp. A23]
MRFILHPYILLSLAVLFWAGNSVVGRAFATDLPPVAMVFWRWVIAAAILLPICFKPFMRDLPILKNHIPYVAVQGFLSITAFNALLYWGLHYTNVVNTSLVQASMPIVTLVFSWLILRKGLNKLGIAGIILSLFGVSWVVVRGDLMTISTLTFNPGDLILLVAVVVWSIYTVLLAKIPEGLSRLGFTFAMVLAGIVLLVPLYGWELSTGAEIILTRDSILAFAYIGIFPSVLSFLCWNRGVELVGANVAGTFLNLMPIFGAVLGMLLLGETLKDFHYVGIVLIFSGIYLVTKKAAK